MLVLMILANDSKYAKIYVGNGWGDLWPETKLVLFHRKLFLVKD